MFNVKLDFAFKHIIPSYYINLSIVSKLSFSFLLLSLVPLPSLRLKALPHLGGGDWRQVLTNQLPLPPVTFDRRLTAQLGVAVPVVLSPHKTKMCVHM